MTEKDREKILDIFYLVVSEIAKLGMWFAVGWITVNAAIYLVIHWDSEAMLANANNDIDIVSSMPVWVWLLPLLALMAFGYWSEFRKNAASPGICPFTHEPCTRRCKDVCLDGRNVVIKQTKLSTDPLSHRGDPTRP